ncbi:MULTISPECIES: DUF4123 domain-containing protein [Paraburkholderia]|uniref:DUF4123 domain-containing protein n=1 Tax=Paraburkholderia ferrariae TaxID=386056 RepID=A0ABU9RSH4_9BURK|nr:DUF4123 domain-containing protein [Paraburkholderia nodosa]
MDHPNTPGAVQEADGGSEEEVVNATLDVLRTYFSKNPEMHCFLAVDPAQRDLTDEERSGPDAAASRAVVEIDHDGFPEAHQPYLIELDLATPTGMTLLKESVRLAHEDRRPESMAAGLGQRIGGWLASSASLAEVAAHWSGHALQYDDQGHACVLRFYDARALSLIWPMLSGRQQQALLGPVKVWHALDASARPRVYSQTGESNRELALTAAQWQQIHRHGPINRALALHAVAKGRQPKPSDIETAVAAAERAERYGLADRNDHIAFIGHALAWHPQFDLYPKVLSVLGNMAPDDFYTAGISELTQADIADIRSGAWYDRLTPPTLR